jgi:phage terminase large subunit-like protein
MPAKARSSRYADRAALQSLGLFTDTSALRALAKRGNNSFDYEACEAKIVADLLPHQYSFVTDFDHRMVALCGGFGSGKSFAAVSKSILLCFRSQGFTHLFLEPTIPLLRDVAIPAWEGVLDRYGIPYRFRTSPLPVFTLQLPKGDTQILLRSFENYNRLIGVNAASMIVDEIDTVSTQTAEAAIVKLQGRVRVGNCPQLGFASTPEGHKALYNMFVREASDTKALYKARTEDNPFLDPGFIENLRATYPANLIEAYLNGEFVNLSQATVFYEFDLKKHTTGIFHPEDGEMVVFGADFNVGNSQSCYAVIRPSASGQTVHIFAEHNCRTTFDLVDHIRKKYPIQLAKGMIACYPDASGSHASTSATESDHDILRSAGIKVIAESRNPPVAETIAHANLHIHDGRILVNPTTCYETVQSLENWGYDESYRPQKGGKNDLSHAGDAIRYLVWQTMPRATAHFSRPRWR